MIVNEIALFRLNGCRIASNCMVVQTQRVPTTHITRSMRRALVLVNE